MGQGLYIKVAQVVAEEFGVDLDRVKITATTTAKVPNTSATAASSGSDLNGMAAQAAAATIKARLDRFRRREVWSGARARSRFATTRCVVGNTRVRVRRTCHARPISRASRCRRPASTARRRSTGTRKRRTAGRSSISPMARRAREVVVDTLTGEMQVDARRHPPRRRQLAQSGDRYRPDRGRLRAGHGLAHHRGTGVRQPTAGCSPTRRRPTRFRRASDVPRISAIALFAEATTRGHDLSLEGGRRAAADAGDLGVLPRSPTRSTASHPAGRCRWMRRRRRSRSCARSTPWRRIEADRDASLADHRTVRRRARRARRW